MEMKMRTDHGSSQELIMVSSLKHRAVLRSLQQPHLRLPFLLTALLGGMSNRGHARS